MSELARWRGRVALVTGASSGIGAAVAQRLAAAGMKLVLCARRADKLGEVAGRLRAAGGEACAVPTDLGREADIAALFARAREVYGGVDVLVNNAGLGYDAPLVSGATEEWREMLELNVLALSVCTREAVQDMQRRGVDGHIVHVSSMSAYRVPSRSGMYSATKFAVRALTEALRQELQQQGSAIRVTAVSPGFVETEFAAVYHHGDEGRAAETYARYKVLEAADVAEAVAYALAQPPHVQVHDVLIRPLAQPN
ncbi:MAG TPA: SDR family NAD(P)-dependent oxidoreductase [Kofleriaceae bacterium]|nr:SDR family NAD(P)-dependent oxidoreductase [Kofleriaceae bacterium]